MDDINERVNKLEVAMAVQDERMDNWERGTLEQRQFVNKELKLIKDEISKIFNICINRTPTYETWNKHVQEESVKKANDAEKRFRIQLAILVAFLALFSGILMSTINHAISKLKAPYGTNRA